MSWLMWLAVIVLVIAAVVAKVRRGGIVLLRSSGPERPGSPEVGVERMLRCEHCNLYIPESESVRRDGAVFCCQEHSLRHVSR